MDEIIGGWRTLHDEELHYLYSSPNTIRMIKSRNIKWVGHVARMGRRRMHTGFWQENKKESDKYQDLDEGRWFILQCILEKQDGVV
jgi:hypothetical protein